MIRSAFSASHNPFRNLAMEEALCEKMRPGDAAVFLWQNENTVVIGRGQNAWRECRCALLEQEGGFLARRSTGGGAVHHDLGNLNFSFAFGAGGFDLERQLNVVKRALQGFGIQARFSGRNDLILPDGRKFSGSAFRHTGGFSLHHGTLMVDVDKDRLTRYLSPEKAKYLNKGVSSVRSRVANLKEVCPDIGVEDLARARLREFQAEYGAAVNIPEAELALPDKIARYASWEWRFGEAPGFDLRLENRFSFGGVELSMKFDGGRVLRAQVYTDAMDPDLTYRLEAARTGAEYGAMPARAGVVVPEIGEWLLRELKE